MVDVFPACLRGLRYELVTTWPDESIAGQVAAVVSLGPDVLGSPSGQASSGTSGSQPSCTATAALSSEWPSEVDLHFSTSFQAIPRGAAVVLEAPDGIMTLPAITLTVHRQVTLVDYLLIPACCGLALILLFLLAVITAVARDDVRDQDGRKARLRQLYRDVIRNDGEFWKVFWRRPLFASAAWTFKDSWATNVTVGVSATGAILAAFGAVSTLFPGVQLDRFAILMAICGAIIAVAPLVFGIASAWQPGPYLTLPSNSLARAPAGEPVILQAVAGASISLPTGTRKNGARATRKATKMPVPANPCPPIKISGRWIALTKDGTVAAAGGSTIRIGSPPHTSIEVGDDGAVVTVVGVADLTLPSGTEVITSASAAPDRPESVPSKLGQEAIVKVPPAGNVMDADMRSVVPAAMVTMFGIGAELGILGVMAWSLSAESTVIRVCTVAVLAIAALIVVGYAGSTTRSLADSGLGSALSASSTSFTY